jgi:putative inorganic carbon (HCO3(-)) transporter
MTAIRHLGLWCLAVLAAQAVAPWSRWAGVGVAGLSGLALGGYLLTAAALGAGAAGQCPVGSGRPRSLGWGELLLVVPTLALLLFSARIRPYAVAAALLWLCVYVGLQWHRRGRGATGSPLDAPVLFLVVAAVLSLSSAPNLARSSNAVSMLVAGVACGWLLAHSVDTEHRARVAHYVFVATGVVIGLGAALTMEFPPFVKFPLVDVMYDHLPSLLPRSVNANYLGGALAFFLPGAVWTAVYCARDRVWMGAASAVMGAALLLTQSRSALVGATVVVLAGTIRVRWVRWALAVLVAAGVLIAFTMGTGVLVDSQTGRGYGPRLLGRAAVWGQAASIARDFPFTGVGLRSFPAVADSLYPVYQGVPGNRTVFTQVHPHNLYLDVAAALGYPGLVAFFALLGAWAGMAREVLVNAPRDPSRRGDRMVVAGLAGGMVAHLLFGLTDSISLGEKAGVVFWVVLGLTAAAWRRMRNSTSQVTTQVALP